MKKLSIIIILLIALTGWALVAYSFTRSAQDMTGVTTPEPVAFDHSNCQYPNRLSNPPDGCDNTDPACPLETKGGSCENYIPTEVETAPWVPEPTQPAAPTTTCQ